MKRVDILLPIVRKGKADKTILIKEIKKLFNKEVIKETKAGVEEERFSNDSLKLKPNTSFRMILNLKQLNENNWRSTLQNGITKNVLYMTEKGALIVSVDLKDASYKVPFHPDYQNLLKFIHKGILFKLN